MSACVMDILEIRIRESRELAQMFHETVQDDDSARLGKGERPEQDAVDEGEHDGSRANPQRRDEQRGGDETGLLAEAAEGIARVLE